MKGTALITGGARRIGRAIALGLAGQGYKIALHYRSSRPDAEQLAEELRDMGCDCQLFQADLENREQVKNLIPKILNQFSDCNVLINNASVFQKVDFKGTNEKMLDRFFQIHVTAPYFLMQAFAQHCGSGHIVNMLDAKVAKIPINYFPYILSKKGLTELTLMAAKALGPGIQVNGIAPGIILPSIESNEEDIKQMSKKVPLQRQGDIDDVVRVLIVLLESPYITGQIVYVDGGEHLT